MISPSIFVLLFIILSCRTGRRISGGRGSELARGRVCPLHAVDGRRFAPDSSRMAMRRPDGAGVKRPRHRYGSVLAGSNRPIHSRAARLPAINWNRWFDCFRLFSMLDLCDSRVPYVSNHDSNPNGGYEAKQQAAEEKVVLSEYRKEEERQSYRHDNLTRE